MKRICREELDNVQPYNTKVYLAIALVFMLIGFVFLASYKWNAVRYGLILVMTVLAIVKRNALLGMARGILQLRKIGDLENGD